MQANFVRNTAVGAELIYTLEGLMRGDIPRVDILLNLIHGVGLRGRLLLLLLLLRL